MIPQVGFNPAVFSATTTVCVGGPADGQEMHCPVGFVLILIDAVDGMRAVATLPDLLPVSKSLGGYKGHYEPGDFLLNWVAP